MDIVHTDIIDACSSDTETMPGFAKTIKMILACDVAKNGVPSLPLGPGSDTQRTTIVDSFVLKPGKRFFSVDAELKKSGLKPEAVGGKGSRIYKQLFSFTLSGTSVSKESFGRMVKNADYFVVVTGMDGDQRLLGTPHFPAEVRFAEGSLGENPEDENGVYAKYEVTSYSVTPFPPRFKGTAQTSASGSVSDT